MVLLPLLRRLGMACAVGIATVAMATPYTVATFSSPVLPEIHDGHEYPGAVVRGEWLPVEKTDGKVTSPAALRLKYDLSKGAYVQCSLADRYVPGQVSAILLRTRRDNSYTSIGLRVTDATGETFQCVQQAIGPGFWQNVSFPVSPTMEGWGSWGGNNDKRLDEPIRVIAVGLNSATKMDPVGNFDLCAVGVDTAETQATIEVNRFPFFSFRYANGTLTLANPPTTFPAVTLTAVAQNAQGQTVANLGTRTLNADNQFSTPLTLPAGATQVALYPGTATGAKPVLAVRPYPVADFATQITPAITEGREFPGAKASSAWLDAVKQDDGTVTSPAAARLNYDFTGGGAYAQLLLPCTVPAQPYATLRCVVRADKPRGLVIRLTDENGETFQHYAVYSSFGAWQEVTLSLGTDMAGWESWGGDKRFDGAVKLVAIGVNKGNADDPATGALDVSAVTLDTPQLP